MPAPDSTRPMLRTVRAEYGRNSRAALLPHTGSTLEWLAPDVLAASWWRVFQPGSGASDVRARNCWPAH
jgi:hypothetical protein